MRSLKYKRTANSWAVYYTNDVYMGDIMVMEDGEYYWWPSSKAGEGAIEGWVLEELSSVLEQLNGHYKFIMDTDPSIGGTCGS